MPMPAQLIYSLMARKLSGEISEAELQELELLLRQYPDEHFAVEIISEHWLQTADKKNPALEKSFDKVWETIQAKQETESQDPVVVLPTPQKINRTIWRWVAAAACLSAIGLFAFLYKKNTALTPSVNEITTRYGSKTKLLLPDSTQVWLNAGSKLSYDNNYGNTIREVKLVGEAYFDVVKNAACPFVIHTDKMDIKVLGTAFNVKCYPGEKNMETSLIHGSIEVTLKNRQSEKIMLKPNEKLVLSDETTAKTTGKEPLVAIRSIVHDEHSDDILETAWVENKLIFNEEPMEELALKMERWYGVNIHFTDEALRSNKITGTFENESVEEALHYLQLTTKFRYNIDKKDITIFK